MSRSSVHPDAPVVITGMGLVTCLGSDVAATWRGVLDGRGGLSGLTALEGTGPGRAPDQVERFGCEADDPAPSSPHREARLLRTALQEAWTDARLGSTPPYPPHRCGYVLGTTLHGIRQAGAFLRTGDPLSLEGFLAGATLSRAARGLHPRGPMLTTCAACSSGLSSIALGLALLRAGELDLVVAGGYDPISEYAYAGFNSLRLVAAGLSRPFCKDRDGLMIGEGYAAVVLERAGDAAARGRPGLAWIRAVGESSDAHHLTQPHPEGRGAAGAVLAALRHAGVSPSQVGLIAAHATGTPSNDAAESAALQSVFGAHLSNVPVVAFKTHIGHTLGGAGAAEFILTASAVRDQLIPPTANVRPADAEFPAVQLNTGPARPARFDAALNISLGFGGANTCAVLAPASSLPPSAPRPDTPAREVLITGIGVIVPGAVGNREFASLLASNRVDTPARAGAIAEEDYLHLINARRVRRMSDYSKLTLAATALAFSDARVTDIEAFTGECSAILGTTHGSAGYCESYYSQVVNEGIDAANPMLFAEGVPNAAAAQLSMMFQVKGSCQTIIGSRTAGLDALRLAALRIAAGEWDRAIVSAGEEFSPLVNQAYQAHGLCSTGAPGLPFVDRRGFTTGAGAVSFILESRASAEARRADAGASSPGQFLAGAGLSTPRHAGREGIEAVRCCLRLIDNPAHILSSANSTWIDRVEAAGIACSRPRQSPARVSALCGSTPEMFSVGPLAAIAGVLLGHFDPAQGKGPLVPRPSGWRSRRDGAAPADPAPGAPANDFGALATDYAGQVSAVSMRRLRTPTQQRAPEADPAARVPYTDADVPA